MNPITQPTTITDMRRDPKNLLARVKKEKVLPILVHSKFEAAFISIDELNRLYEELKTLRREQFVQETLEAGKEVEECGGHGPFNTAEEIMEHLTRK